MLVAQICLKGHVIKDVLPKFCENCGQPTIYACPKCQADIRGLYGPPGARPVRYRRPSFCPECGSPYPWTRTAVREFRNLAELADGLTLEQREQLSATIDDIIADTPRTNGAVARIKLLSPKIASEVWQGMRQIIVDVASEAAKKQLGL